MEEIEDIKLLCSRRDGSWVITRDKNDRGFTSFRPNLFRDIEPGTVRQLVVHHIGIKRFLFDDSEGLGDRLACLDLILFIGKHPFDDATDRVVVVYHQDIIGTGFG